MISKITIDKVFETAVVEEVIGDFIHLKKSGSNYKGLSPFTDEKTPSFIVSPAKQIWKDFSSGKGGNVVAFLMEHDQLSYPEAIKYLAKKYNIGTTTKTYALKEGGIDRVQSKALSNCHKLVDALENYFPHQPMNLRAFRISSELFPCYTLDFTNDWYDEIRDELKAILAKAGELAIKHSVRLSVHPGQYTVLGSNNADVVKKSIVDLEYHALYGQYMNLPAEDFTMNIHLQGLYLSLIHI